MKRTFKKVIASFLAFVLALSSFSAFAFESGKELLWDYYSEGVYEKYYYNGELSLGKNAVKEENGETFNYYNFNAEKAGFYIFDYPSFIIDFMVSPEYMKNGRAVDIDRAVTDYRDENGINYNTTMLYMDKGENIIGAYFCRDNEQAVVTVEFMGEEITDIEFEENAFKDLIDNYDIQSTAYGKTHYMYLDATLNFSSGKSLEYDSVIFDFTTEDSFPIGNTTLNLDYFGYKKSYSANICKIIDFVSDVEFYNLDDGGSATVGRFYASFYIPSAEGYKVTYTDGRTEIISGTESYGNSEKLTLENGRSYNIWAMPSMEDNGDVYLEIQLANHTYDKVPMEVVKISFAEDLAYFFHSMSNHADYKGAQLGEALNNVRDKSYTISDFFFNIYRLTVVFFDVSGDFLSDFFNASEGLIRFHLAK